MPSFVPVCPLCPVLLERGRTFRTSRFGRIGHLSFNIITYKHLVLAKLGFL